MEQAALFDRYRRDRRKLLEFLLSSGFIKELRTPSGSINSFSNINFDTLSADYILHCVKSGGIIDVTEATEKYVDEAAYPVTLVKSQSFAGDSYFLVSDPDISGSPPRRAPPPIRLSQTSNATPSSRKKDFSRFEDSANFSDNCSPTYEVATDTHMRPSRNPEIPMLGLPGLKTGLSDDDLRESAYELLLASVFMSRVEGNSGDAIKTSVEDRKNEKSSKFLSGLKSKKDKMLSQSPSLRRQSSQSTGRQSSESFRRQPSQSSERNSELMEIFRVQMQISEAMDASIRRNLMQLAARRVHGQIDHPHISLGLLNGTFQSDFRNEKSYMQWKNRQANILEEFLCFSSNALANKHLTVRSDIAKIRDDKWDTTMSPSERVAVLASIRQIAVDLSSSPVKFGIQGETSYWASSYHVNIRLYEKLLFGVFDLLDEDQLIEEADEILSLIKLSWSALGITNILHNVLYGWVLFQQFVETDGEVLLEKAILELQKAQCIKGGDEKEEYINAIKCSRQRHGHEQKLNLVSAICLSMSIWCDSTLQAYHLHYGQKPSCFKTMMALLSVVGFCTSDDSGKIKLSKLRTSNDQLSRKLKSCVKTSIKEAYRRVARKIDLESKVQGMHPLAVLAKELKLIAEREFNVFWPVLRQWCPQSLMISVFLLHQYYGERLKPFLQGVSTLSEEVRSVLPGAEMLDSYLTQLHSLSVEANQGHPINQTLDHYLIGEVSKPLILDWVISQHAHILEWTGRAFDIEDWEPLSFHQRQAASIVEVFRIVEETVDQFFGLNLPMDITHLQALLSIIFHSVDTYLQKMLNQLVDKQHLCPSASPLTRYTETTIPVIKKRLLGCTQLDDNVNYKLNDLTISKLCIRLNTLQYIQKQVGILEDGIRKSWSSVQSSHNQKLNEPLETSSLLTCSEAIDALFSTTLSIIKETASNGINKMCDFTGTRVVFWDLRDKFLFHTYRGDVENSRLEGFLPHVDSVLDLICGLIDDTLRDRVVLSIFRASVEAYVWILLDGGPSRAFSESDVTMMEDDFIMLKDFFIADGEGLPRSVVDQEAKSVQQILGLFSLQTETIIKMLMNASEHISMGLDSHKRGHMQWEDAHTLIRVLCHKKDREASKFLKRQYDLPMSSEYEDITAKNSASMSPFISDILKRSYSTSWTKGGQSSFKSIKKKLQEATSEIRNVAR